MKGLLCYRELKSIHGLKRGELGKIQREEGTNGFGSVNRSMERFSEVMTDEEIAKVGFFGIDSVAAYKEFRN